MAYRLKPSSSTIEINEFLAQVHIPNWVIHKKLVEFNDAKDKDRKITLLRNKLISEGLPEDAAINQSNEIADGDLVQNGIKSMKQSGSILMVCGIDQKDLAQVKTLEDATKHVQLMFLKDRKVNNA